MHSVGGDDLCDLHARRGALPVAAVLAHLLEQRLSRLIFTDVRYAEIEPHGEHPEAFNLKREIRKQRTRNNTWPLSFK